MKSAFVKLKKTREMFWSGRRDLNSGPPAPKSGVLSLGSPSFSIAFLKTKGLSQNLVVAPCTEMWLHMHRVPPISPSAKKQHNTLAGCQPMNNTSPSAKAESGQSHPVVSGSLAVVLSRECHADAGYSHRTIWLHFGFATV